ncbi:PREDICTED: C-type lectin domain family 2 member B-like [Gekko japonicus]|uniref:C-type lectin domain family 2 member B-like n=1 Tax=Gekko japonicus TaxID=146911 RepID=A0ABM1KMI0_GEKJA|nr:PREDICTED: C-type lectin domain family 2 member B-like [Gekko japonicus]
MAVALMEHNNHTEGEPDVTITLMNGGTLENGPDKPDEHLDAKGQGACQKFKKKSIIIITVLLLLLLGSVIGNIIQAVQKPQSQAPLNLWNGCPLGWIKKETSCYFVSHGQQDWDSSQTNCSSYGASLLTLDSKQEWALVNSGGHECWIDLQRKKEDEPWKWRNGSDVTQFEVKGTGLCAYVSHDMVSSTNCDNIRHWLCRKPVHAA